jgi:uncharacterized protein YndB with AHSA1/START domain
VEGDLRPGGEFRARFTSGWEGTGRVEACEPPRRLRVLTWESDEQVSGQIFDVDLPPRPVGGEVLESRDRCDIKARWDELIPAYRTLAAGVG